MNALVEVFSGPAWRQILLTLAHSLWQGAVLALLLAALLTRIVGNRPNARYWASLLSLAALVGAAMITWSVLDLPEIHRPVAEPSANSASMVATSTSPASTNSDQSSAAPRFVQSRAVDSTPPAIESADFRTPLAAVCSAGWLAGVMAMLARMVWLITGVRRLAVQPLLTDQRVLDLVAVLRRRLGILRSIRVVNSSAVGPAVLGIVRPVLLLPGALISELPPECLEAILAHELAHIRRHDYLVNLLQMLVEAALFFNPAVWWINRQIRREREACCDALAVSMTGQPLTYAEALAAWLERMAPDDFVPAAAGWLGSGERGTLLDRVRRLLVADYQPELRGSWSALVAGLTVSLLVLAALWTGTRAGIALAAEVLSHSQLIQQFAKEQGALRPLSSPNVDAILSGTIHTADGSPLPPRVDLSAYARKTNHSPFRTASVSAPGPTFSLPAPWGKTWLVASAAGYAPFLVPPFETKPGEAVGELKIGFAPGFTSTIRIVDQQSRPIPGATVSASLDYSSWPTPSGANADALSQWQADDEGLVVADCLADFSYQLSVSAPGFQILHQARVKFAPGREILLTLIPVQSTRGEIVSPQGDPIARATIRRPRHPWGFVNVDSATRSVLATTDDEGRFTLDRLDAGPNYGFLVETPSGGRLFVPEVRSGETGLRWIVGAPITFIGRLIGATDRFLTPDGARIRYEQTVHNSSSAFELVRGDAEFVSVEGQPRLRIENLFSGNLTLKIGKGEILVPIDKPTTEMTINVPATRRVSLRFVGARTGLSPQGEIAINLSGPDRLSNQNIHAYLSEVAIENGVVEFDAYSGGEVSYAMENVVGYSFERASFEVPVGSKPLEHDVPMTAAGAIRGQVLNADGTPTNQFSGVNVGASSIREPAGTEDGRVSLANIPVDDSGACFVSPLPLGGLYVLRAVRGFEVALSRPVRINADNPNPTITTKISPMRKVVAQLLGTSGQPLSDAKVCVEIRAPYYKVRYMPAQHTDREGRLALDLSTDMADYWLVVAPGSGLQPIEVQVPLESTSVEIRPTPGLVIEGRVVDIKTGEPLAGVELVADPTDPNASRLPWSEQVKPVTDTDGHFRFDTLAEGTYRVHPYGGVAIRSPVTAHTGDRIVLQAHTRAAQKEGP